MDYKNFLDDYATYNEWNRIVKDEVAEEKELIDQELNFNEANFGAYETMSFPHLTPVPGPVPAPPAPDMVIFGGDDRVNSPSHYTSGKQEVIDIIEDAIKNAPNVSAGMLQGQVLKYMLRCWLKDNPVEDMKKAQWYLNRLIIQQSQTVFRPFPSRPDSRDPLS